MSLYDRPAGGEIDIIERVNNDVDNLSSLHTSAGCDMPANRDMRKFVFPIAPVGPIVRSY